MYDLATNIPKDQFDVVVALGGTGILIQKLKEQNIRILPILALTRDVNIASDVRAFFELWSIFHKERPDVVHLNSAKAGGMGALAACFANVPKIIFTAHGWAFNEERSTLQRLVIKFFSWITILLSHKTIAVSNATKDDVCRWPFVKNKIVVIKNGTTKPDFFTRDEARAKFLALTNTPLPPDTLLACTIAELHKNKGLQYSIEAIAKLVSSNPSLFYFILGDGEEQERLNTLIKSYGLENRIFLLGFVEDASRYLTAFDIFVLPSITESLGLVLLEAGFAGLPVVASQVGGIPEIIENGQSGILVPARNTDALVRAIQSIISDTEMRVSLSFALSQKIALYFSLSRELAETLPLYTKK